MFRSGRAVRWLAMAGLLLTGTPAPARDVAQMEEFVGRESAAGRFMGAVLVAKDGTILLDEGYGAASLKWGVPNGSDVKYRIGSVTKQFTAASILLLHERDQLELDAPISRYLDDTPRTWRPITVRHLLNHTSGIPNFTAFEDYATLKLLPATRGSVIARFRDEPLDFVPGTKFSYSNSGYLLLSAIIEDVSGQSYASFLQDNIFTPLAMDDSGIADNTSVIKRHASGYTPGADGPIRAEYSNLDIPRGAGAIFSTTHDLLKWQRGLYGGAVISESSLQQFVTPALDDYAFGIFLRRTDAGTAYVHGGGIEGFNSWLGYDPDRKITVVVLGNLNGQAPAEIGAALMGLAQGGQLEVPVQRSEAAIDPDRLSDYEGTYALAPTFKIRVFAEKERLWAQATGQPVFALFAQAGKEDFFFLKAVDAQLRFSRRADGSVESLTLYQGGREQLAPRE